LAYAGYDDMRGDKAVVPNYRVMPDVIAAPQHNVIAHSNEGLHHIILKNKTMFTQEDILPDKCARTDV